MRIISKGILILAVIAALMTPSFDTEAKTVTRYATKTIKLQERCSDHAKTIEKLRQNDKVILLKKGKRWSRVKHGENVGYCKTKYLCKWKSPKLYTRKQFKRRGRIRWRGWSWTWYTQRILPGRGLKIPGRHVDKKTGYVLDKDGYIVLASSVRNKKKRLIVPTPYGRYGRVYDTNGRGPSNWRDVYTNW